MNPRVFKGPCYSTISDLYNLFRTLHKFTTKGIGMKYISILVFIILFVACNEAKIPKVKKYQYELDLNYEFNNDELVVNLRNTLKCPIRIWGQPQDENLEAYFNEINPLTLGPLGDTSISIVAIDIKNKELTFASRFGDVQQKVISNKVQLPFQRRKEYKLIQGYNSSPTHNTDWSRYALDFGLKIGDTICAATSGYVVGVIEEYKYGGSEKKWKDYANCVTIFDPVTGLFTQYVHLKFNGSLVSVGDRVIAGQNIAISGMTGYTNIEHLHFNCLKPVNSQDGLISIQIDSIGEYLHSDLKRNVLIMNKDGV